VQIFFASLELIEDHIEQVLLVLEFALKESEIAAVEFHPETFPLQMLNPACPEIPAPVFAHPPLDTALTQIVSGLLTLDPLVAVLFLDAFL